MNINDKRLRKAELENEAVQIRRRVERIKSEIRNREDQVRQEEAYLRTLDREWKELGGWNDDEG